MKREKGSNFTYKVADAPFQNIIVYFVSYWFPIPKKMAFYRGKKSQQLKE